MKKTFRDWVLTIILGILMLLSSTLNANANFDPPYQSYEDYRPDYLLEKGQIKSQYEIEQEIIAKALEEIKILEEESREMLVYEHNLFYSYMAGSAVTNTESQQYKLISQAYVSDYGILAVDGYYLIAMGTYYADYVGRKYEITFANGTVANFMIGDIKQDRHTYNYNCATGWRNNDIIEFIINPCYTPEYILKAGSFHVLDIFNDYVVEIKKVD